MTAYHLSLCIVSLGCTRHPAAAWSAMLISRRALVLGSIFLAVPVGCRPAPEADEAAPPAAVDPAPRVVLETTYGRIVLKLDRARAPVTVQHFLRHVEVGFYDSLVFHRVEPGFVIQTGGYRPGLRELRSSAAPIENEGRNGLSNLRGSVAMARLDYPHSATTQFFVNLADNRKLDADQYPDGWGHAVFGRVVAGMDVVDRIARVPTGRRRSLDNVPLEPVVISRAFLEAEGP